MTNIGNTYEGDNGSFTSLYYKRNGEWFGGFLDNQTGKRKYGSSCYGSGAAAENGMMLAKEAAGKNAKMALN